MSDDDDHEVAQYVRAQRRGAGVRLVVVGAVVLLVAIGTFVYGRQLQEQQAHSRIKYALPDQLAFAGLIAGAIAVLFIVLGAVIFVRARARAKALPEARVIRN
jgi:hypothetical protein